MLVHIHVGATSAIGVSLQGAVVYRGVNVIKNKYEQLLTSDFTYLYMCISLSMVAAQYLLSGTEYKAT